ncbi:DUF1737 domain-containing protein [bacterium]|nr:MAG: DUF1737 domain-containing protein [bacterium]
MAHEYKLLTGETVYVLSTLVTAHLADGFELWGNPFAVSTDIRSYLFCQAVVRQVEREHGGMRMAQEPAGYTVGVPETPEEDGKRAESRKQKAEGRKQKAEDKGRPVLEPGLPRKTGDRGDVPTFEGVPCDCFEIKGDNPKCAVHKDFPAPAGIVS